MHQRESYRHLYFYAAGAALCSVPALAIRSGKILRRTVRKIAEDDFSHLGDTVDPGRASGAGVLSPNCRLPCRTGVSAIRRLKDTRKDLILVWFNLANAMIEPATKGDGICETPH